MKRFIPAALFAILLLWAFSLVQAQSGVTAEAIQQANLRASPGIEAALVGQILPGTAYPVLGKSEFFPWLLLGDVTTLQPIGWVFQDIVNVRGDVNTLAVSTVIVDGTQPVTTQPGAARPSPQSGGQTVAVPSATPAQVASGVSGVVKGEINIRYGPGADYPRVGVAQAGARFEIVGYHTQFPWVQVSFPGVPGNVAWIAQDLLDITGDIYSLSAVTAANLALPTLTPTPSVVDSSSHPDGSGVPLSPEFAALGNQVWMTMMQAGFDLETQRFGALFVLDLQTGEAFSFGSDIAFSGTSIGKIAILARLYETLTNAPDGKTATDIANTMICSNNTSTNSLLKIIGMGDEWLGAEEVSRFWNQLGLSNSFLTSPYLEDPGKPLVPPRPISVPITEVNQSKANPDLSNQLTVENMGWLLEDIYECAYEDSGPLLTEFNGAFEPRECRQMLHVMSNNNVDGLLKAGVPENIRVAHKHGWINDTHSNAAVFFTPGGNYVVVIAMFQPEWLFYNESLPVMAEISRTIYNYYNPDAPMPAIREGFIPETPNCNFAGTPLIEDLRQPIWDR